MNFDQSPFDQRVTTFASKDIEGIISLHIATIVDPNCFGVSFKSIMHEMHHDIEQGNLDPYIADRMIEDIWIASN